MINDELNIIIKERCENDYIYEYIIECLVYFKSKNSTFYEYLCYSISELLSTYPSFKFICDDKSYFSLRRCKLAIRKTAIECCDYSIFAHEIIHAIHGLLHSYNIPLEYEYLRTELISKENFMVLVCVLMRYVIQSKIQLLNALCGRSRLFEKYKKDITIVDNIEKYTFKENNINETFEITNKFTPSPSIEPLLKISNQLNRLFISLIDDIQCSTFISQQFHVFEAMEGMIDSILLGKLYDGCKSGCFYLEGWGHEKEYFKKDTKKSFIELIADYAVLIAYNDTGLIEMMKTILGEKMIDLLNTSLSSMIYKNNYKRK